MQRWLSEQPGKSPYHNIGSVASNKDSWMQTSKSQAKQQTATSSNQATTGTWADESQAEGTEGKKEADHISLLKRQDDHQDDGFDNLVKGKGKGLIHLLHGPPGVGKLYTANQLVAILLRMIEYYDGILFFTTNREHTIDPAFRSCTHLSIAYPPISVDGRRQLWNASITRAEWLSTTFLERLAEQDVNGREIRNVVRVGYSFARNASRDLKIDDLLQSMCALK
ncbi:MAG: hypothetical protein Q9213_007999 [Squamulea squamosa]